jgi:ATP-dependent DNA helicase RecG
MGRRADSAAHAERDAPLSGADPVSGLERIGPKRAEALGRLGILTVGDLLRHFPRRYDDRRVTAPISQATEGARINVMGTVTASRLVRLRGRMSLAEVTLEDMSGRIKAVWFGQGYLARTLKPGATLFLSGVVGKYGGPALRNPDYEVCSGDADDRLSVGRIVPVYPLTEGLSQRMLRRWTHTALDAGAISEDVVPAAIALREGFPPHAAALRAVHFPENLDDAEIARKRFAYEELFVLQAGVMRERLRHRRDEGIAHPIDGRQLSALRRALPFTLTPGQAGAAAEILADMAAPRPMARLLQGDVGCGKTLVALIAAAACVDGGRQAALMAPTELLATQHYRSALERLGPQGVRIALITGSGPRDARDEVQDGSAQLAVGTHALFEDATRFHRLGLVIVDEQHRFGVGQRERLALKGAAPDRLHMTATPIPRTLALTLYGAMDLTIIADMPPGREAVRTAIVARRGEAEIYAEAREEARHGRQTFIVCPRVETSARNAARGVLKRFEALAQGPLKGLRCGLVHGRMDAEAKDAVLEDFRAGRLDVLIGTTVVEVGVDAPGATIMIVEEAASFGLTQLHQLRGRVGRGRHPGRCFLMEAAESTPEGRERLEALCRTHDGFRIAEEDFALRGPGEVFGEQQAGLGGLRAAHLLRDAETLVKARRDAEALIAKDPELRSPGHAALARAMAAPHAMGY